MIVKTVTLLLVMALVGGGAFWAFGRHTAADAAVTDAMTSALARHSADFILSGSGSAAGQDFTLSGHGALDFAQNAMQMSYQVTAGGESLSAQGIYLGQEMHLDLGPEVNEILPGKSWLSLNVGQLAQGDASQSLGTGGSTIASDPAAALVALSQSGNKVSDLGSSSINGVNVEGYLVHLDAATLQKEVSQGNLPSWMQDVAASITRPDVNYQVFVDGSGQLARMTTDVTETVNGQTANVDITMDLFNYGAAVNVTAPPADEVGTLPSFLRAAASVSDSSLT